MRKSFPIAAFCFSVAVISLFSACADTGKDEGKDGEPITATGQSDNEILQGINQQDYTLAIVETFDKTINGVRLILNCNASEGGVIGTVENTSDTVATKVTVGAQLSNKEKLTADAIENLAPGEKRDIKMLCESGAFNRWDVTFEVEGGNPNAPDASAADDGGDDSGDGDSGDGDSGDGASRDDG